MGFYRWVYSPARFWKKRKLIFYRTHRGIQRPRPHLDQRWYFAGEKKEHGIRFQGILTPDGILHLHGPYRGPTGDWRMWENCGMEARLRNLFPTPEDRLYLYGDPAYCPAFGIMGPFRGNITPAQEAANIVMSGQRITVEWAFGLVLKNWLFLDFKAASSRIGLQPVAAYYMCATILTNARTCLHGRNQISDKYSLAPPSIEEYFGIL